MLVVVRVVADVAGDVLLLEATDAVHEPLGARLGPRSRQRLRVALVGLELDAVDAFRRIADFDRRQLVDVGQTPRLTTVRDVAVGQHHHWHHVLGRDAHGFVTNFKRIGCRGA